MRFHGVSENYERVHNHCHFIGKYRGAAIRGKYNSNILEKTLKNTKPFRAIRKTEKREGDKI